MTERPPEPRLPQVPQASTACGMCVLPATTVFLLHLQTRRERRGRTDVVVVRSHLLNRRYRGRCVRRGRGAEPQVPQKVR